MFLLFMPLISNLRLAKETSSQKGGNKFLFGHLCYTFYARLHVQHTFLCGRKFRDFWHNSRKFVPGKYLFYKSRKFILAKKTKNFRLAKVKKSKHLNIYINQNHKAVGRGHEKEPLSMTLFQICP